MGLCICRSIIEAHGGQLWAIPCKTAGCSLSIYDPCHLSGRIVIEPKSLFGSKPTCEMPSPVGRF